MEHVTVQKTSRFSKLKVGIAAVALGALLVVPSAGAQDTVTQQVNPGTRTASITDLPLTAVPYSHIDQPSTGTLALTADDSSGSDAGWNVTVLAGAFTGTGATPKTFAASNLVAGAPGTPAVNSGQAIDTAATPAGGPKAGVGGSLEVARKVISAEAGFGKGNYSQNTGVTLTVPGQTLADTYTSTLTVSITAGP